MIHVAVFILLSGILRFVDSFPPAPFQRAMEEIFDWGRFVFFFYMAFDTYHTAQKKK